jgi:phage terminase large subunit-like protein
LIQWYDRKLLLPNLGGYSLYITTDLTTTSASSSDFCGIGVWAVSSNWDYYLLDLVLRKMDIDDQHNALFRLVMSWSKGGRVVETGIEVDGQQLLHLHALKQKMMVTNRYFTFARQKGATGSKEGIRSRNAGSKHERFRYMVPQFQNGKIYFPNELKDTPDMKEALKQLRGATHTGFSDHDDFCDVISQLGLIDIIPGSGEIQYEGHTAVDDEGMIWTGDLEDKEVNKPGSTVF